MTAQEYDSLPNAIQNIVGSLDDNKDLYSECKRIQQRLHKIGWACDYGLDGSLYNVKQTQCLQTNKHKT